MPAPDLSHRTDATIVRLIREGDERAEAELVRRYQPRLERMIYRMIGDPERARDLAQETLFKVFKNLGRYEERQKFAPWVLKVGRNTVNDYVARATLDAEPLDIEASWDSQERRPLDLQFRDPHKTPSGRVISAENVDRILRAASTLPVKYRECFLCRDFEGLEYKEIATIVDLKPSSVREYVARARAMLKEKLTNTTSLRGRISIEP